MSKAINVLRRDDPNTWRKFLGFKSLLIVLYLFSFFSVSQSARCLLQFRQADGRQCAPTQWVFRPGTIRDDCGEYPSLSDLNRSISYVPPMNIFSQSILSKVNSMKSSAFCSFSNMQFSILLIVAFNPLSMLYQSYSVLLYVRLEYKRDINRTISEPYCEHYFHSFKLLIYRGRFRAVYKNI